MSKLFRRQELVKRSPEDREKSKSSKPRSSLSTLIFPKLRKASTSQKSSSRASSNPVPSKKPRASAAPRVVSTPPPDYRQSQRDHIRAQESYAENYADYDYDSDFDSSDYRPASSEGSVSFCAPSSCIMKLDGRRTITLATIPECIQPLQRLGIYQGVNLVTTRSELNCRSPRF